MRGTVGGMVPGVAVAVQRFGRRHAFRRDKPFERRQPMPVVGLAAVGIAGTRAKVCYVEIFPEHLKQRSLLESFLEETLRFNVGRVTGLDLRSDEAGAIERA